MAVYLDSSALVKLVIREQESEALREYLRGQPRRVSSALARVELARAARVQGMPVVAAARRLLADVELIALDDVVLDAAAELPDPTLRTLDAIHVASAQAMGSDLAAVVTYDMRMARIARALGLPVATPE